MGGGSGGHVTPVVAVLAKLRQRQPHSDIRFWCDKKFAPQAARIMHHFEKDMPVRTIVAGKLRRYHHLTLWQHIMIPSVLFPNLIDSIKVLVGFVQSFVKLIAWRPDVIFMKGGYVCLPVGWAARVLRIPYVIHDSDAHPGLTNRLLASGATFIATGAPLEYYTYPARKTYYVGIPVAADFIPRTAVERAAIKQRLGFSTDTPLVVVTGGGLGAKRINDAIVASRHELAKRASTLLITGVGQYKSIRAQVGEDTDRLKVMAFVSSGMADLLGAADIVVARAGATSILELVSVAAPTILVPNGRLTGGHQLKNAKVYADAGAVAIADEEVFKDDHGILLAEICALLNNATKRQQLRQKIHAFARPHAARDMADLIERAAKNSRKSI